MQLSGKQTACPVRTEDFMQDSAVPILVVQEGQLAGKRWPLNKLEFVIGRGEDCDIVLPDRQVSRFPGSCDWPGGCSPDREATAPRSES